MPDLDLLAPVDVRQPDDREPEEGIALCLSGGGYRAMLFHLGALWRLNDAGYLRRLDRVSSVSGGSVTAGVLGLTWSSLTFDGGGVATNFGDEVVTPIRRMAGKTIDRGAVLGGIFTPGSISAKVIAQYEKILFGESTLQDLPADGDGPRFVINATNLQTGVLWRFSRPYMADYLMGRVMKPSVSLSEAVAASSAFPPILSPAVLEVESSQYDSESQGWAFSHLQRAGKVYLSDGGVYDNLGLETAWKRYRTILVSDGGGRLQAEKSVDRDWVRQSIRVLKVIDSQVRSLRKRQVIDSFVRKDRRGTYWGIDSDPADYGLGDPFPTDPARVKQLAETPTRLKRLPGQHQERLINWGYAICDTAMRKWVDPGLVRPDELPYPSSPIG
jgi:NTE family protein